MTKMTIRSKVHALPFTRCDVCLQKKDMVASFVAPADNICICGECLDNARLQIRAALNSPRTAFFTAPRSGQ